MFDLEMVSIEKPEDVNFILGQSHFIKTVEDLHEAMVGSVPGIRFGIAFCEASGKCLVRWSGNDDEMMELAKMNALKLSCGHSFIIFMKDAFPINFLNAIKNVSVVCSIYCATANPTDVIVAKNERGRGIMGVVDGSLQTGIETEEDRQWRLGFLRKIGYKLG
ncbi:MAG: adenosine-specific kinase [Candidatus Thermoplasmatota archaeon]|nr:adenosine-specific kinase [Candidatus Thermoplasmatota archaeon]